MTIENKKSFLVPNVTFYNQRLDVSNYKLEGFSKLSEAKYWSSRICGLACIKMGINALHKKEIPLYDLLIQGLKNDAYSEKLGWNHQALANLAILYKLNSKRESVGRDIDKIGEYIKNNEIIIASVTVGFEAGKKYHSKNGDYIMPRGGHLVVIFGVNLDNNKLVDNFTLHHPSSWKSYEWPNYKINRKKFLNSFSSAGNIIRISNSSI